MNIWIMSEAHWNIYKWNMWAKLLRTSKWEGNSIDKNNETGYEFNVGLWKIETGHEINKSRNEFAHNLRINWNDKQFS